MPIGNWLSANVASKISNNDDDQRRKADKSTKRKEHMFKLNEITLKNTFRYDKNAIY